MKSSGDFQEILSDSMVACRCLWNERLGLQLQPPSENHVSARCFVLTLKCFNSSVFVCLFRQLLLVVGINLSSHGHTYARQEFYLVLKPITVLFFYFLIFIFCFIKWASWCYCGLFLILFIFKRKEEILCVAASNETVILVPHMFCIESYLFA